MVMNWFLLLSLIIALLQSSLALVSPIVQKRGYSLLEAKRRIKQSVTGKPTASGKPAPLSDYEVVPVQTMADETRMNLVADKDSLSGSQTTNDAREQRELLKLTADMSSLTDESLKELLQKDIKSFNADYSKSKGNPVLSKVKDVFGAILIADFFVVLAFLVWFLAAAALQSTNPFLLEKFQDVFQPVVVPCLTVLMVGSFVSGIGQNDEK